MLISAKGIARTDPAAGYADPQDVLRDPGLTTAKKRELLHRWALDAYLLDLTYAKGQPQSEASRLQDAEAQAAEQVTRALVGRTVADVERDLILETLKHCLGNRTHAANILGISIRTLRNKLKEYAADGAPISPPGNGELRGAGDDPAISFPAIAS